MSEPEPDTPTKVGQQLAARREELDLTQAVLAARIGITTTSVGAAERGRSAIIRSKRAAWERALHLRPGTLSRAYREGADLEPLDTPTAEQPYADLSDRYERAVWEMTQLSEADRKEMIDMLREGKERRRQRSPHAS